MLERMKDPEFKAKMMGHLSTGRLTAGRTPGLPDGYSKKQYEPLKKAGLEKAKKVMTALVEKKFIPDNDIAHKAINAAVEVLCLPGAHQLKLQAAKVLLDFTQRKPVSVSETTLKTAESFLDDIVADDAPTAGDTPSTV